MSYLTKKRAGDQTMPHSIKRSQRNV